MGFGPVPLDQAEGAILAHSVPLPERRLRKGRVLGAGRYRAACAAAGCAEVTVARLGPGRSARRCGRDPAGAGAGAGPGGAGPAADARPAPGG